MAEERSSHSFKRWQVWLLVLAAMLAYMGVYALFVQGLQGTSRYIAEHHLASVGTVVASRFGLLVAPVLLIALVVAARDRSWRIFHPGNLKLRLAQGAAQTLQNTFIVMAAGQLSGKFQALCSLALVGFFSTLIAMVQAKRGKHDPVGLVAFAYPAVFVVAGVFVGVTSGAAQGDLRLGLVLMALSGACTSFMHIFTEAAANESFITSTLWQNGPAAILTIPMWFFSFPLVGKAELPTQKVGLTVALLALVAACSLIQQMGLQLAAWICKKIEMGIDRLVPLRGVQVFEGAAIDSRVFDNAVAGTQWISMGIVLGAMVTGWFGTRPKSQKS